MGYILVVMHLTIFLSEVIEIPYEIHSLCPYTDICNRKAVKTFNVRDFEIEPPFTNVRPCCTPCRCDDKCGLRVDCCFAEMDKYKLVENGKAVCRSPVAGPNSDDHDDGVYYFMIQSCRIEYLNNSVGGIVDEGCLYDESGQPNIAPVSSVESKLVYINTKCAECNDVYNYTVWSFESNSSSVNLKNSPVTETRKFFAPHDVRKINREICFNELDSGKCSNNNTLETLCRNLYAPFEYKNNYYQNVFCATCSLSISTACFTIGERPTEMIFTYLIDNSVVEKAKRVSMLPPGVQYLYKGDGCLESTKGHEILCPEGMLNTPDGCQYYITKLKIEIFTVQLKLEPVDGDKLTEEMLSRLNVGQRSNPLSWIHMPCLNLQDFDNDIFVYKEINNDVSKPIKSFVIQLRKNTYWSIELPEVVLSIRQCLRSKWSITLANSTFAMNASLDKHQAYVQDGLQRRTKIMSINDRNRSQEKEARSKMFDLISKTSSVWPTDISLPIGKIFFCRNIELATTEVTFGYGEITIVSSNVTLGKNELNITLGNNEFMIKTKVDADGKLYDVVVVCVEDFFCDRRRIYTASRGNNIMLSNIMLGVMVLGIVLKPASRY